MTGDANTQNTFAAPRWRLHSRCRHAKCTQRMDHDRRRFLGRAAMTIAAAHAGLFGPADAEGASRELTALGRAGEWLNSPRLTAESLARQGRARRFLHVYVHQLAAHAAIHPRLGAEVPAGTGRDRRAHARVRIRTERRQRPSSAGADADRLPDRDRQRLRDLARVRQPLLACAVFRGCAGTRSGAPLWRGRVRTVGEDHPTAADRSGRRRRCRRRRLGRSHRRGSAGGLGQPEIAGELRRLRPHRAVRVAWRWQIGQAPGVRGPCAPEAE